MREVVEGLRPIKILADEDIRRLQDYIEKKFPRFSSAERARVLADAIHKAVDRHLEEFDPGDRVLIRTQMLKEALGKERFDLRGDDVLRAGLGLERRDGGYFADLARWANNRQPCEVTPDGVWAFYSEVRPHRQVLAEKGWDTLLDRVKEEESPKSPEQDVEVLDEGAFVGQGAASGELNDGGSPLDESLPGVHLPGMQPFLPEQGVRAPGEGQIIPLPEPVKLPVHWLKSTGLMAAGAIIVVILWFSPVHMVNSLEAEGQNSRAEYVGIANQLPEHLKYRRVDTGKLQAWLAQRNSMLAEEPYLSAILQAAKDFNVDPLLLVAITGQEQNFVPKTDKDAARIANNPFNVYYSWEKFNTNINEASRIAARTVVNLSEGRPQTEDPIAWINRKYAGDKGWWVGVSRFHRQLVAAMEKEGVK